MNWTTWIVLGMVLMATEARTKGIVLVKQGISPYTIVLSEAATPSEQYAGEELQRFLKEISGAYVPIARDATLPETPMICVGASKATDSLGLTVPLDELGDEGFILKTQSPHLVLAGGRKRGTLYGCYQFLEDELGCRWFTATCSKIPKRATLKVRGLDEKILPPLEYRATDYPNSRDPDWAARNRMNGHLQALDEKRGGHVTYHQFVHTFNALIPPETTFDSHPEYFSLVNGARLKDRSQLCLTNPAVIQLGVDRVKQWIAEAPGADIYSVSQNDWWNYCQCENCNRVAEEEGGQSGPLVRYLNTLAESIEKDHPDKALDTLAYQYTRKPPLHVIPKPNVIVRLCTIECCFAHPLDTDAFNAKFAEDIRGWNQICKRLYIWDYVINYAHSIAPFPNLYVLKPNINFFIQNGVKGIYEEANYYSKGGEFAELRSYVLAKTLWDPSYDTDRAIDEFVEGYYEAAARPIRDYIDLLHGQIKKMPQTHMGIYSPPSLGYLTPEVLQRATRLFEEAEANVGNDKDLLDRVQVAKMPLLYAKIFLVGREWVRQGDKVMVQGDVVPLLDEFERIARAENASCIRESGDLNEWIASVRKRRWEHSIVTLRGGDLSVEIVPSFGGKIISLRDDQQGQEFLRSPEQDRTVDLERGGYEEYTGLGYRSPGWQEVYEVTEKNESTVVMTAALGNGLTLTRRIQLDPQERRLRLLSTVANASQEPKKACLRIHPEFAAKNLAKASLRLKRGPGWEKWDLKNEVQASPENEKVLEPAARPEGSWSFRDGAAKRGIVHEFDPKAVDKCLVSWSAQDQRLNLELFSPEVTLAPGEKLALEQTVRVVE